MTSKVKYSIGLVLMTLAFLSCGQSNTINGLVITPSIKDEAEKHFKMIDDYEKLNELNAGFQIFENNIEFEFYENDSLVLSTQGKVRPILFKSFYFWQGDTLTIDGGIGLFGGGGFSIEIVKGKATVYHMLSSDNHPTYAYGANTELIDRLEVPCHDVKAIISEFPIKGMSRIIYGYVEFKSEDYYTSQGTSDEKEFKPRQRSRSNMKMYFKSGELKI